MKIIRCLKCSMDNIKYTTMKLAYSMHHMKMILFIKKFVTSLVNDSLETPFIFTTYASIETQLLDRNFRRSYWWTILLVWIATFIWICWKTPLIPNNFNFPTRWGSSALRETCRTIFKWETLRMDSDVSIYRFAPMFTRFVTTRLFCWTSYLQNRT